jgi:glycine/D-amino acid oxidase-like deaminating enzyme
VAQPDAWVAPAQITAPVVVIGGGIAGLATAWQLGALGLRDVLVLEAEPLLASHASARNAAIFLPLEDSLNAIWLATRSRDLLDARLGTSWLSAQGVALVAGYTEPLDELRYAARKYGVFHERWTALQIESRLPLLASGDVHHALYLPLGGVIDVHRVLTSIKTWAKQLGARIETSARVQTIEVRQGRVARVVLDDGRSVVTERVVMAAGAWTGQLASQFAPLLLTPLRRHLVLLGESPALASSTSHASPERKSSSAPMPTLPTWKAPVVWRVDDVQTYFRPESGLVLASPCDESPQEPGVPQVDPGQLETLSQKLESLAPALADAEVRRVWACLRTVTEDRELAVGSDPRVSGLYWVSGLGGRGMTCGVAAGELLARLLIGLPHPLMRNLAPTRLI